MSDERQPWWRANQGIVGLTEGPWDASECMDWPTDGYDGHLHECDWHKYRDNVFVKENCYQVENVFEQSGHTKDEWMFLADTMIKRWADWKAFISTLEEK